MSTPNFTQGKRLRGLSKHDTCYRTLTAPQREQCYPSWLARVPGVVTRCGRKHPLSLMDVAQRVVYRLTQAEAKEPDAWLRDDLRIARLTVFFAGNGKPDPWRFAFWWYLGQVPEKLIPQFQERERGHALMEAGGRGGIASTPQPRPLPRPLSTPPPPLTLTVVRQATGQAASQVAHPPQAMVREPHVGGLAQNYQRAA